MSVIPNGMSLRDALKLAERLGVPAEPVRRTGEVRIRACGLVVTHNVRRKDASRALVTLLRRRSAEVGA